MPARITGQLAAAAIDTELGSIKIAAAAHTDIQTIAVDNRMGIVFTNGNTFFIDRGLVFIAFGDDKLITVKS